MSAIGFRPASAFVIKWMELLGFAKYMEGYLGAIGEMTEKIFELIYEENNDIGEVSLVELAE